MQTGTLIVIEDIYQDDPQVIQSNLDEQQGRLYKRYPYGMKSHSHPVVSYCNKNRVKQPSALEPNALSEGIVWDKVELSDVKVLCYSDSEEMSHPLMSTLVTSERYNDAYNHNNMTFQLSRLVRGLQRLGIPYTVIPEGVKLENVKVTFIKQTPNNMFLYGLKEGYAPYLDILVRWSNNLTAMENSIIEQIDDYRAAIAPYEIIFKFDSREEQWIPLAEKLNAHYSGR